MDNKEKQITALDDESLVQVSGGAGTNFNHKDIKVKVDTILRELASEDSGGINVIAGTRLDVLYNIGKWYQVYAYEYDEIGYLRREEVLILDPLK